MSSHDVNEMINDSITPLGSSVSTTTLPAEGNTDNRNLKKRKLDEFTPQTISEPNINSFKVLKKLNIQLTRTNHHCNYLSKCQRTKTIPKSLRVNLTPQVPVVNSYLQLKWEEAQHTFGLTLTSILLDYWDSRKKAIQDEITVIMDIIKENTTEPELEYMTTVIDRITTNIERDLSTKKPPNPGPNRRQ